MKMATDNDFNLSDVSGRRMTLNAGTHSIGTIVIFDLKKKKKSLSKIDLNNLEFYVFDVCTHMDTYFLLTSEMNFPKEWPGNTLHKWKYNSVKDHVFQMNPKPPSHVKRREEGKKKIIIVRYNFFIYNFASEFK